MKILFATQFFDPEPVMKGVRFARELGYVAKDDVTVVTGFPNYPAGKLYDGYRIKLIDKTMDGEIEVIRLPIVPGHGRNVLVRMLNYMSFYFSLLVWGLFAARKYDIIYVYHPPMTVGFAVAMFAGFHRIPFIIEIQDLWPESVVASGIGGAGLLGRVLGAMCRFVYRRAQHVVAQSHGMAEKLVERGVRTDALSVIYNWSNSEDVPPGKTAAISSSFEFLYTGNIGIYQDLDTVIAAARIAHRTDPRIRLTMIGGGGEKKRLANGLSDADLVYITFRDAVPQAELPAIVGDADCLVLHLRDMPFFAFTIPSKIPFYLAMGKPVLAGMKGEAAGILIDSGAAEVVAPEDPDAMAQAMLSLTRESPAKRSQRGIAGAAYYAEKLAMDQAIKQTHALLQSAFARSG